jgi:hydrogenase expression/formation protein HypE
VNNEHIRLGHGAGGVLTKKLVEQVFQKHLTDRELRKLEDSAILPREKGALAFTTDSYVVSPLFFPGGDIGKLSITGTINDLVVMGARPVYISAGFIIEEGLPLKTVERVVKSMSRTAKIGGVRIVTADTKVVEHGKGDGLFITTSGIGILQGEKLERKRIKPGDTLIVTGTMGDHGATILLSRKRDELKFETRIKSDCAPLNGMLLPLFKEFGSDIHWARDITRGGLFTILNEAVAGTGYEIRVREREIPVDPEVKSVCEVLGLDPFYLANEGKVLLSVDPGVAESVVRVLRRHPYGRNASIIGSVSRGTGQVYLETTTGGLRIADSLLDDPVPRIC